LPFPEIDTLDDRPRWSRDVVLSRLNAGVWRAGKTKAA
jgi:hypothetical protein